MEDTNVSTYCSFNVTCASWRKSQRGLCPCLCQNSDCVEPVPSLHEWRDLASPFWTVSQAWTFIIHQRSLECCLGKFCFCSLSSRRLILVFVEVLTIIKWKASRHNADMYQWLKRVPFGTQSFLNPENKTSSSLFSLNPSLIKNSVTINYRAAYR